MRAYMTAASARRIQPTSTVAVKRRAGFIAVMITLGCGTALWAADPPGNIAKRVAQRESETAEERSHYAYTQSVRLQELDGHGSQAGEYKETREVIFSPAGERSEAFVGTPVSRLKDLIMTPEDFDDIRNIQPFVLTADQLWNYDVDYKGGEPIDGADCWALRIRPKQILSGRRWFDGMLWVRQDNFSVVKSEGQAVPQIITAKQENLFPRFVTVRKLVNGFWFPATTMADDTLYFRNGPIREKLIIRYNDYKRFGSQVTVTFEP
jgi:hypothetical protein